ncbi:hypothetical protein CHH69_18600, partial [Terribacillus saccharophilus]|uniref:hypothetical protein n=1 Tax=Terribacillus saccharophilus TaxID=361277 RepID=UPI000BD0A15D
LIEAQRLASFPVSKPTFIPEGYAQTNESFAIINKGEEPVVSLDYSDDESTFDTQQLKIDQTADIELPESGFFVQPETYSFNGHEFEFISREDISG